MQGMREFRVIKWFPHTLFLADAAFHLLIMKHSG